MTGTIRFSESSIAGAYNVARSLPRKYSSQPDESTTWKLFKTGPRLHRCLCCSIARAESLAFPESVESALNGSLHGRWSPRVCRRAPGQVPHELSRELQFGTEARGSRFP